MRRRNPRPAKDRGRVNSRETGSPKVAVGFDDLSQPLFRAAVATIGVGMKPLHEFLIPGLYLVQACGFFKIEHGERIQLRLCQCRAPPALCRRRRFFENGKPVLEVIGILRRSVRLRIRGALAKRPSRAMARYRIKAEALDLRAAHALEEIPIFVVLPQVCAAEPVPIIQIGARLGNVTLRGLPAPRQSTGPRFRDRLRTGSIDANVVAEARTVASRTHGIIMGCKV
jgi:hypothetical protein